MEDAVYNFISENVERRKFDYDSMQVIDIKKLLTGAKILDFDFINFPLTGGVSLALDANGEVILLDITVPESLLFKMSDDELRACEIEIGRSKERW